MASLTGLLFAVAVVGVTSLVVRILFTYRKLRGTRVVACPQAHDTAAVEVNMPRAVISGALGRPQFELRQCSHWPERRTCGRDCVSQIVDAPTDCLVRQKLAAWSALKNCAVCGAWLGADEWLQHEPALVDAGGAAVEWSEIPAERLSEILQTHSPICWNCHVALQFRQERPELVTDNPWTGQSGSPPN